MKSEREILTEIAAGLRAGRWPHDQVKWEEVRFDPITHFSMSVVRGTGHCGTVGCIEGIARYIFGMSRDDWDRPELDALVYPPSGIDYAAITPLQAAAAIDNYLAHGEPRWHEVLA